MSSVDNFVRDSILSYPVLMPNRTAVLHHVFVSLAMDTNGPMRER